MSQTLIKKLAQSRAVGLAAGQAVKSGDFLEVSPAHATTHDNTGAVMPKFRSIGANRIDDPLQPIFTLDHDVQNRTEANVAKCAAIEAFAEEQDVRFHPAGCGPRIGLLEPGQNGISATNRNFNGRTGDRDAKRFSRLQAS
jgi:homoaconitate hydratase